MRVILDEFDGSFLPILQSFKAVMPNLRITGVEELGDVKETAETHEIFKAAQDEQNGDVIDVNELFARDGREDIVAVLQEKGKFDVDENRAINFNSNAKFDGSDEAAKFERNFGDDNERKSAFLRELNLDQTRKTTLRMDEGRQKEILPRQNGGRQAGARYESDPLQEKVAALSESLQGGFLDEKAKTATPNQSAQELAFGENTQSAAPIETAAFSNPAQTDKFTQTDIFDETAETSAPHESAQAALFDFDEPGQNLTPRPEPKTATERKKHETGSLFTDEEVRAILELK